VTSVPSGARERPPSKADLPSPDVRGPLVWDFLTAFFASRRGFHSVFVRYEARVLALAAEAGVHRDDLVLGPADLARLFYPRRLRHLRDRRLGPLRALAHALFRDAGVDEPLDTTCSHVFHEFSILMEEHESVVRFQHLSDPRRYGQMFEEVRGYYPLRLRRIRRLFADGSRRLEELLPAWGRDRVVVRSLYLFGERMLKGAYEDGLERLYGFMYPGGAAEGYLEAARSFALSRFDGPAGDAARRAEEAAGAAPDGRRLAAEARQVLDSLEAISPPAAHGPAPVPADTV
jgi:hypothetical protein